MGEDVIVITASPLGEEDELQEGFRILRTRSLLRIFRALISCDLVISRGGVSRIAVLAGSIMRCKIVCFHEMATPPDDVGRRLEKTLTRLVSLHVGVTCAVLATKFFSHKAKRDVLYNPVAEQIWADDPLPFKERVYDVLFVGRVIEGKGILDLIRGMIALKRPLHLGVLGEGPAMEALTSLLSNAPQIKCTRPGFVERDALRDYYRKSKVVVLPSSTHPEGMGMVVAEAMATGTPVLISDQTALTETMGKGGRSFTAGSSQDLARELDILLRDEATWAVCQEQALQKERQRFSLATYRKGLARIIEAVRSSHWAHGK